MILHQLQYSIITTAFYEALRATDEIILIAEGLYATLDQSFLSLTSENQLYMLNNDAAMRGIALPKQKNIHSIDYSQFIELSLRANKVIAWR